MNPTSLDIETIVREVLAQLRGTSPPSDAAPSGATSDTQAPAPPQSSASVQESAAQSHPPAAPANNALRVDAKVVSLAALQGRLEGVRRVVVSTGAVVTPAVRDELRRRKIALDTAQPAESSADGRPHLTVVAVSRLYDLEPLGALLRQQQCDVELHTLDCLFKATDLLAGQITGNQSLGVMLTRRTATALCLTNRKQGVRAMAGDNPATVAATADEVGANLLVLDPWSTDMVQLKRSIVDFCRGGVRPCPELLRERLG